MVKYNFEKLAAELLKFKSEIDITKTPTLFKEKETGNLILSAEDGGYFADYYGEFRGNDPWIDPKLEEWAKKKGLYWEWRDPGSVMLSE